MCIRDSIYAALAFFARKSEDIPEPRAIIGSALVAMSWAAGCVAYGAARDRTPREERTRKLSAAAGFDPTPREERLASALAVVRIVSRAIGLPGVGLALV